jgi:hypothetical protein
VEYKQLIVKAFEQAAGKWRASVKRSDGKPLMIVGRAKLAQFVTGLDSVTANDALLMAVAAIDAGAFLCRTPLPPTSSARREIEAVIAGAPSSRSGRRSLPPVGWPRPSTVVPSTFAAAVRPDIAVGRRLPGCVLHDETPLRTPRATKAAESRREVTLAGI